MNEASNTASTFFASFCFKEFDHFFLYYSGEVGFSDFSDEPAENASGIACFVWFDEAQFSEPQVRVE